jgi:hypothetical protein
VQREWESEELIASWTLVDDDWRLVGNKSGTTRLGFALLLKFFEIDARFPRHAGEVPPAAMAYVAGQVRVPAEAFTAYDWSGRTLKYHRSQSSSSGVSCSGWASPAGRRSAAGPSRVGSTIVRQATPGRTAAEVACGRARSGRRWQSWGGCCEMSTDRGLRCR